MKKIKLYKYNLKENAKTKQFDTTIVLSIRLIETIHHHVLFTRITKPIKKTKMIFKT